MAWLRTPSPSSALLGRPLVGESVPKAPQPAPSSSFIMCCQVSVFYRNFTDLSWLSSRTTPLGYKRTERGTPSQPCITSPFKQQTISQSCSHHFLLKYKYVMSNFDQSGYIYIPSEFVVVLRSQFVGCL